MADDSIPEKKITNVFFFMVMHQWIKPKSVVVRIFPLEYVGGLYYSV